MDFVRDYMRNCRSRDLGSFISSIAQVVRCIVATIVQA